MSSLAPKTRTKYAVLGKTEATYGAGGALAAATDGIRVLAPPGIGSGKKYAYDGSRPGKAPGTTGRLQRVGREGAYSEFSLRQEMAGGGAAYAAAVLPVPHLLFLLSGWKPTIDTTVGAEKVTYVPGDEADYLSGVLEVYEDGEKWPLAGVLGDGVEIAIEMGRIAEISAAMKGILTAEPVDAALPAGLAYNSTVGAKATQAALTIGTFAPVRVQSAKLTQKLALEERAWDNVNGRHGGWHPGMQHDYQLEVLCEAVALETAAPWHAAATLNPGELARAATALAVTLDIGATQYKKFSIAANQAQLADDPREVKGAVTMWKLLFDLMPSSETTKDEVTITFD